MKIRDRISELRRVPASELRPNPKNWRTHPKAQADALKGVLAEVGIADAVLARELEDGTLMLLDGHLRVETMGDQILPVLVLDVNEAEGDKVLATLDPLAAMAESDAAKLDAILREVDTGSPELQQMLSDLAEDAGLYQDGDKEIVEDEVPEPPVDPITKPGDLWILGEHRLLCGDSTKAEDVERLMAGAKANCMVTDPPYGIGIASNPVRQKHAKADWDAKPVEPRAFVESVSQSIVWGGNYFDLPPAKGFFVWDKKQPEDLTLAMCEMAWTNVDTPAKMFRLSVTSYDKEHPTQKPVGLIAWCLSYAGGDVFDPFLGSGTTLIAAEQLGRKCYGMEISPQYCDVIVKRWETLTGKKAELETPAKKPKAK
jgi:site-specific DNA-methyltransferase (adenine-specific)/modification methylase